MSPQPERVAYGDHPSQFCELHGAGGRRVAVIHGGFWRQRYDLHLEDPVCTDLAGRGWTAWNLEYRRLGGGGGWPATFDDVRSALAMAQPEVVIGHSAGGHLAMWAAAEGLTGRAASQAGVVDLAEASRLGLSGHAGHELLGGPPEEHPDRYAAADPARRLPIEADVLLVHGARDGDVPVSISRSFAARGGGRLVEFADGDHYGHLDPASEMWGAVLEWL